MATKTQYYNLDKPSYEEVADIEIINANMDKIDKQMRNNADGVNFVKGISSDAYDNSKSYAVGDYCIYDNKLYRCITAIESAEAFNIAKWKQTTVGKEVKQLNSNLGQLEFGELSGTKNLFSADLIENKYISLMDGGFRDSAGWSSTEDYIKIKPNTTYTLSGIGLTGSVSGYAFYDISKNFISSTQSSTFTTPDNANYIRVSTINDFLTNPQLEEGTQATEYEPYIPSVKMLADEVSAQNESLGDYGLVNKATVLLQGGYRLDSSNKLYLDTDTKKVSTDILECIPNKAVSYKTDVAYDTYIGFLDSNKIYISDVNSKSNEYTTIAPPNAKYFFTTVYNQTADITPKTVGHVGVYINNAIDELKNDLSVKKFELVAGALWLCVSGKHCVLTLNGYNLTETTYFDKLEEYQPYLVARNVVSKGDSVCIAAVDQNGNINASDLVVGTQLTGQLFGEISWIANI